MKKILTVSFLVSIRPAFFSFPITLRMHTGFVHTLVGFFIGDYFFHNPDEFRSLIANTGMVPLLVLSILMYLIGVALILYHEYDRRKSKSEQPPLES